PAALPVCVLLYSPGSPVHEGTAPSAIYTLSLHDALPISFLEREANRHLADIRARAQREDERLNAQFAQQALQLLAGLDPMQNLQAGTLGFQSLMQQAQDAQRGCEDLIAGLVSFCLDELQQPEPLDALSNLWSNITGRGRGRNTETTGGAGTGRDFQLRLGDYSTLFSGRW